MAYVAWETFVVLRAFVSPGAEWACLQRVSQHQCFAVSVIGVELLCQHV